jgi:hypothetical protein
MAVLDVIWAAVMCGIGIWNLGSLAGPTWLTIVAFVSVGIGLESAVVQIWLARRMERALADRHLVNPS